MPLRILGGKAKGQLLKSPPENSITRPTSVMLKRKFFDAFQDLGEAHFYDLCAGSGSVGIEAWSRGVKQVELVEKDPKAVKVIKENIQVLAQKNLDFRKEVQLKIFDVKQYLSLTALDKEGVYFFDPPYENTKLYEAVLSLALDPLQDFKLFVVEFCHQKTMSEAEFQQRYGEPLKSYHHSTHHLYVYSRV